MSGNVGGLEHSPKSDISDLRQKLKGYGSWEAFIKEILQNTDDAKCTLQRIAWLPGREDAAHPLLRGPALALINNGALRPEEVHAIKRMGLGTKGAAPHAIGKFGQGIKTVFQVCEAFFFLSGSAGAEDRVPAELHLCNPWKGWKHDDWNRFEDEDVREIIEATAGLWPAGPWFMLYLPLRRTEHLGSGGQAVSPIMNGLPGNEPRCPASLGTRLAEEVPALLPLLKSVATVEFHERWEGSVKSADLTIELEAGSERCSFHETERTGSDLRGRVCLQGTSLGPVEFTGLTRWFDTPELSQLAEHSLRPRVVSVGEDGAAIESREKVYPHAGIAATCRPATADGDGGCIELRWAVFLPVGEPVAKIPWPVPLHLQIALHGYFFLDAARTRVDGQDFVPPFQEASVINEQTYCRQWNRTLVRQGTLPLLPQVLARLCREQLGGDVGSGTDLTRALRHSFLVRDFQTEITATHHWALRVRAGGMQWEAIPVSQRVVALPPARGGLGVITAALPGLRREHELAGAAIVIHGRGAPGDDPALSLLGAPPMAWNAAMAARALEGIAPEQFAADNEARAYLRCFLDGLPEPARHELLANALHGIRMYPVENVRTGAGTLFSPQEAQTQLAVGRLLVESTAQGLARALARVLPGEWWQLADPLATAGDASLRQARRLDLREAAHLVLQCADLGAPEARHELLHLLAAAPDWLVSAGVEKMAARYLAHGAFDRREHPDTLFLQSPEPVGEWGAIAEYVLGQSAQDWRLISGWIDLRLDQQRALGIRVLRFEECVRLLRELGSGTDFSDLPQEQRAYILRNVSDVELLRQVPIHELTTGALSAVREDTLLDSDFVFADPTDQELWLELSQHSRIVRRERADPMLTARQQEVFADRIADAEGIMRMAIQQENASRYWPLILACLARIGTPRREVQALLVSPQKRWLPLLAGGFVSPANVLSIPGADEAVHRLLGEHGDGAISILALDERARSHAAAGSLRRQLVLQSTAAAELLALALGSRPDCRTGLTNAATADDLRQICVALEGIDVPGYRLLPLLRSLGAEADRLLPIFARELAGVLDPDVLHQMLVSLATKDRAAAPAVKQTILAASRQLLACALNCGQWSALCSRGVLLPNRRGEWKTAAELVHAYEGATDEFLVRVEFGELIFAALPPGPTGTALPRPTGARRAAIETYAAALAVHVPRELVGVFVAILGGTLENCRLAAQYLVGRDIPEIMSRIIPAGHAIGGRVILLEWRKICFHPEIWEEDSLEAVSLAGTAVRIPVRRNHSNLLFGDYALQATAYLPGDGERINHRLQLLDLRFFDALDENSWTERVVETLRRLLASRYCLDDFSGLHRSIENLRQSHGEWDIRVAQRMILKAGDQLIQTLGVHRHDTRLADLLATWQQAKQYEAQCDEGLGGKELQMKARDLIRSAEDHLQSLLAGTDTVRAVFLQQMRRKMEDFQYFADSVLFELFQNADDATVEQCVLDGIDPHRRPGNFKIEVAGRRLRIIHHGRPINRQDAAQPGGAAALDYGRDLQKMLLLNASDKAAPMPGNAARTGRFGLGFKSVHRVTDSPVVVSGELAFRVWGGVYPQRLEEGPLREELQRIPDRGGLVPTIVQLDLTAETSMESVTQRFVRLCAVLTIFAYGIREISVDGPEPLYTRWQPRELTFYPGGEIGETLLRNRDQHGPSPTVVLRVPDEAGRAGTTILLALSPTGFEKLPEDLPALWATAPLDTPGGMLLAVNGGFEVDAGRRQLAGKSEENGRIFSAAAAAVGAFLAALSRAAERDWTSANAELQLSPETTREAFWLQFWRCLPRQLHQMDSQSPLAAIARGVLFSGPAAGAGCVLLEENVLPTRLGNVDALTRWRNVRYKATGLLDECADLYTGLLENSALFEPGSIVSESRVLRLLGQWFRDLDMGHVTQVSLETFLFSATGAGGIQCSFPVPEAEKFGRILTPSRLQGLKRDKPELWQNEWEPLAARLQRSRFLARDGEYREAAALLCPEIGHEEEMRAAFAPPGSILSAAYRQPGVEFFQTCRGKLQIRSEEMMGWARTAAGECLAAVLRYLLDDDADVRVREQMIRGLGRDWIAVVERQPEFDALSRPQKETLWERFKYNIQYAADVPPTPEPLPIINTTPQRLLAWWRRRGGEPLAAPVLLTGEWGRQLFRGLLDPADEESVAAALLAVENGGDGLANAVWFRTLCFCCLLGTRTQRTSIRRFLDVLIGRGFWEQIEPAGALENDEIFELAVRGVMDDVMRQELHGINAAGEDAEFWRRIFYDVRKMYRAVYLNGLPAQILELCRLAQSASELAEFLRSGTLRGQAPFTGLIGQSFSSPIFFLLRELRRLRVIDHAVFDRTCFYVSSPVCEAAGRLGIAAGEPSLEDGNSSFDRNLDWSAAIFDWIALHASPDVTEQYLRDAFDIPFSALKELDGYDDHEFRN